MSKLYVIARRDLPDGAQAAQATHAAVAFVLEHLELARAWNRDSNNLVELTVSNEAELVRLLEKAACRLVTHSTFREPDFGNALTAIALMGDAVPKLVSSLPLRLRPARDVAA